MDTTTRTISIAFAAGLAAVLTVGVAFAAVPIVTAALAAVPEVAAAYTPETAPDAAAPVVAAPAVAGASASALTAQEVADLRYLQEEEKLAHDVYVALYEKWGLRTFSNISVSEQRHTDTVASLLDSYGVDEPDALAPGRFENDELQALYDKLVARGSTSLASAIEVGLLVERIDIADIDKQLAHTNNADVESVYANLRAGSVNHLSAFTRVYERQPGASASDVTL